jgi:hypothetical protein
MSGKFLGSNPILPVVSVVETARFFREELGFTTDTLWKDPSYGVVSRGNTTIEFGEGRSEHAGSGVCLIFVEDADAVYKEWEKKKIVFVGDLSDREYGNRDFRVNDNNGNVLIISQVLINQKELLAGGCVT